MAEAVASRVVARAFRPGFHLWMVLLMTFFVFGGFGMTYLRPIAVGTLPPTPPVVHLHGAIYFAWMLLLVAQSLLINTRNLRLHRSLGNFGIALAGALVLAGALITIVGASIDGMTDDDYGLFYLSVVAPPSFAILFAMAIRAVRTPAVHRDLILLATVSILMPGINRLYMMALGLEFVPFLGTYLTMDAMVAAVLYNQRRATGGISRAAWIGVAIILVPQVLFPVVAPWPEFREFIHFLGSLAYYR